MLQLGVVGSGDVARRWYAPLISRLTQCRIVAISSSDGVSASKLAQEFGIGYACAGYKEVVERNDVDAVLICAPTDLHDPVARYALDRRKHVLVEKPLCGDYASTRALLRTASQSDTVFYPAFNNYFRDENAWLRALVLGGVLGQTELIDFHWYRKSRDPQPSWFRSKRRAGGGVLMDLGTHLIHLALSMAPERSSFRAFAHLKTRDSGDDAVDDVCMGQVILDNKCSISIRLGWDLEMAASTLVGLRVVGGRSVATTADYQGARTNGFAFMIEDFINHIEQGIQPDLRLTDDTMQTVQALYTSADTHAEVAGAFLGARKEIAS